MKVSGFHAKHRFYIKVPIFSENSNKSKTENQNENQTKTKLKIKMKTKLFMKSCGFHEIW